MNERRLRRLDMRGLEAIHQELLARYGDKPKSDKAKSGKSNSDDSGGVDLAMLELSVMRAELVERGPHWRIRARLAAGYGWRLLVNRPFAVGNKRMALAAMVTSLEMNGMTWECGEVEETVMVQRAAAGHMKEDEWEAWVVRSVGKKTLESGR